MHEQQKQQRRKRQTSAGVGSAIPVDVTLSEAKRRNKDERIVGIGTGSVSLDSRRPTITIGDQKYKVRALCNFQHQIILEILQFDTILANSIVSFINGRRHRTYICR